MLQAAVCVYVLCPLGLARSRQMVDAPNDGLDGIRAGLGDKCTRFVLLQAARTT